MHNKLYIEEIKIKTTIENDDSYLSKLPLVKNMLKQEVFHFRKPVTFFVGENGTGKSTLLEAIAVACGFNAEGGTKNFCFSTNETHSRLFEHLTIVKGIKKPNDGFFLRAESFYNVATEVDKLDKGKSLLYLYGGKSLHEQSHGESFMSLVLNRFNGKGVYILDEPEAALSPSRQLTLLAAIHDLVKKESQLIIATHSPILMAYPNADIYVFSDKNIKISSYENTEHYLLTKQFLNETQRMLNYLLEEES